MGFDIGIEALGQQPAASGGWLSRWWKGSTSEGGSGPVQVKLGQENAFYYDKELKRWVNKNVSFRYSLVFPSFILTFVLYMQAGPEEAKPTPPPPPPRAATASPSKAASMMRPPHPSSSAPPQAIARAASAMDFSSIPDGRVRSSLVPPETGAPPPPMGGSRPPSVRPSRSSSATREQKRISAPPTLYIPLPDKAASLATLAASQARQPPRSSVPVPLPAPLPSRPKTEEPEELDFELENPRRWFDHPPTPPDSDAEPISSSASSICQSPSWESYRRRKRKSAKQAHPVKGLEPEKKRTH